MRVIWRKTRMTKLKSNLKNNCVRTRVWVWEKERESDRRNIMMGEVEYVGSKLKRFPRFWRQNPTPSKKTFTSKNLNWIGWTVLLAPSLSLTHTHTPLGASPDPNGWKLLWMRETMFPLNRTSNPFLFLFISLSPQANISPLLLSPQFRPYFSNLLSHSLSFNLLCRRLWDMSCRRSLSEIHESGERRAVVREKQRKEKKWGREWN